MSVKKYEALGSTIPSDCAKEENEGARFAWFGELIRLYSMK